MIKVNDPTSAFHGEALLLPEYQLVRTDEDGERIIAEMMATLLGVSMEDIERIPLDQLEQVKQSINDYATSGSRIEILEARLAQEKETSRQIKMDLDLIRVVGI